MPTPNELTNSAPVIVAENPRPPRPQLACPEETQSTQRRNADSIEHECPQSDDQAHQSPLRLATEVEQEKPTLAPNASAQQRASPRQELHSDISPTSEQKLPLQRSLSHGSPPARESPFVPALGDSISYIRCLPSVSSSFLRPGSKFAGKQTSDRSTYEVHVEIKHVDMGESFLCGYLRIKGATSGALDP